MFFGHKIKHEFGVVTVWIKLYGAAMATGRKFLVASPFGLKMKSQAAFTLDAHGPQIVIFDQ
jgi:hypothetical protein